MFFPRPLFLKVCTRVLEKVCGKNGIKRYVCFGAKLSWNPHMVLHCSHFPWAFWNPLVFSLSAPCLLTPAVKGHLVQTTQACCTLRLPAWCPLRTWHSHGICCQNYVYSWLRGKWGWTSCQNPAPVCQVTDHKLWPIYTIYRNWQK